MRVSVPATPAYVPSVERLLTALERPPEGAEANALAAYVAQVANWNRKIDLTAAREPDTLAEVLLADACVLAAPGTIATQSRIVDVGTGAGAPIVAVLLLRPDLSAVCVEPLQK